MASQEEIRQIRLEKLKTLQEKGVNAYPIDSRQDAPLSRVIAEFDTLKEKGVISLVGRVMSLRPQGGLIFFNFNDGTGKFQGLLKKAGEGVSESEAISSEAFDLFEKTVDIGDFVEVHGTLFVTKRGEKTLQVSEWKMLAKSLRPLPEKWHGLQDVDERFRHRYLDILMNDDVKTRFLLRSKAVSLVRKFFNDDGYIEVETPRLQTVAGGATAKPFVTHHNALDTDFYLTIAQELYLKQLLVGGFTKVYEIGRKFRNEGIDTTHNPEFTMLESQEVYGSAKTQRDFIERLFKFLIQEIFGTDKVTIADQALDFSKPFEVITFLDLIKKHSDLKDPMGMTEAELVEYVRKIGGKADSHEAKEDLLDTLYKKLCRPNLIQPTFIIDYPVAFNPFSKRKEDDPSLIDRFQLVINGIELVNAFSELNNPVDQKERYLQQDNKGKKGEEEISPTDLAYLEAMEYGMPPNGGIGIGIDRLAMLLSGTQNIKEVILFPTLKPERADNDSFAKKSRGTKVAVAVINDALKLEDWQRLNAAAHLGASLGAHVGKSLLKYNSVPTKDGEHINLNIQHAIIMKKAASEKEVLDLVIAAKAAGLETEEFTREMISSTNDKKVAELTAQKDSCDIERLGVLVFGEKETVESLTAHFSRA